MFRLLGVFIDDTEGNIGLMKSDCFHYRLTHAHSVQGQILHVLNLLDPFSLNTTFIQYMCTCMKFRPNYLDIILVDIVLFQLVLRLTL